jgi:glycosyltransferase involved in cell wall biosynthesis
VTARAGGARPLRVLHAPHNVGNQPQQLARAEREVGLDSWCVSLEETYRRYPTDEVLLEPHESRLLLEAKRWGLVWRALRRYDVVHFNSGQSLLPPPAPFATYAPDQNHLLRRAHYLYGAALDMNDLYLLRKAGKGIVVTYQGDDARQATSWGLPGSQFEIPLSKEADHYTVEGDAAKRRAIAKIARYADRIFYVNPDLAAVLPETATFLPYASLDPRDWQPVEAKGQTASPPLVVHAPFQQGVKGTRFVIDAVRRLQDEGVELEFVLLEGKTFEEARRLYERADLLVDQLLLGWYGGIAVEFMALGKPVVCHIRESDLGVVPDEMRSELPIIRATTETIYDVLRDWLTARRDELPEVGRRGRAYVERWHDPLKIAAELKGVYEEIASS